MSSGGSNFQRPFHILLSFYVCKVQVKGCLLLIKLFPRVDNRLFQLPLTIEELDNLFDITDAIYLQLIDDCCFPRILLRNNESLKAFFTGFDSNRQCSFDRLNAPVKTKFSHHQIAG